MTILDSKAEGSPKLPDRWTAHAMLERPLLGVLARLARQGFVTPPPEGVDLIHDLFLEEWNGLDERYDPAKGNWRGYVYKAFVHFARRRILQQQRWRRCLINVSQLEESIEAAESPPGETTEASPSQSERLLQTIRLALAELPFPEGDVLRAYLASDDGSERTLAQHFGMTRYRVQEVLTDALGRIVASLGEPGRLSPAAWRVVDALWREGRSVRQTAAHLRLSVPEVQQTRHGIARMVRKGIESLRPSAPIKTPVRPRIPILEVPMLLLLDDPLLLFESVLRLPNKPSYQEDKESALAAVRQRAPVILRKLRDADVNWDESLQAIGDKHPEWIAEVYRALGEDIEALPAEDQEMLEAMLETVETDQRKVEDAFGLACEAIDEEKTNLLIRQVMETPAFQTMGLAMMVFYAAEAVAGLLSRILQDPWNPEQTKADPFVSRFVELLEQEAERNEGEMAAFIGCGSDEARRHEKPIVPNEYLVEEIGRVVESPDDASKALLSWLLYVAPFRPCLFRNLKSEEKDGLIRVTVLPQGLQMSVAEQWGRTSPPEPESARKAARKQATW